MKKNNYTILFCFLFIFGCVPVTDSISPDKSNNKGLNDEQIKQRNNECDLYLSFAISNYQNRDFRSTIDNYLYILNLGCGKRNSKDIYNWLGRSYMEINNRDSAAFYFNQGLKYLPNNEELLNIAAWNAGKIGNIDDQIYFLDKILSINENNPKILENLSNIYRDQEMYEDQINIINIWLKYEPSNKNANSEKKAAFSALGKEVQDVDKERWESDPSNIQYGLDYIYSLEENDLFTDIINVCNELLTYEKYNKKVLKKLGDAYLNNYDEINALSIYKSLSKVDPADYSVAIDISKILINKEDYSQALSWADKAIDISGNIGETHFQRAEVIFELVQKCSFNEKELSPCTRAVYELSWQEYSKAANVGYIEASKRKKFLEENYITNASTWFMLGEGKKEIFINECDNDCYSWLNESIRKRN